MYYVILKKDTGDYYVVCEGKGGRGFYINKVEIKNGRVKLSPKHKIAYMEKDKAKLWKKTWDKKPNFEAEIIEKGKKITSEYKLIKAALRDKGYNNLINEIEIHSQEHKRPTHQKIRSILKKSGFKVGHFIKGPVAPRFAGGDVVVQQVTKDSVHVSLYRKTDDEKLDKIKNVIADNGYKVTKDRHFLEVT